MEMVKALKEVTETNRALIQQPRASPQESAEPVERVGAITGLEYKQNLPVIKDTDTNLERHVREFQSILDCHTVGKKGVRPYAMLSVFRKTLAPGSTRLKVYDTVVNRARKQGRLPEEAKAVFDELLIKLGRTIRETLMQRKERVEKEFDQLMMGKLSHSTFRAEWEYGLEELE